MPMRTTTRFLTGSLAAVAVASTLTLASPAFAADQPIRPCGQPAVAAVYVEVVHEGVLVQVPAVTHDEWRWERTVSTRVFEFSAVVAPAHTETDWTREVAGATEFEWSREVIDQAYVPAVPESEEIGHWQVVDGTPTGDRVEYEYIQRSTGHLRWEAAGWNADKGDEDKGKGWTATGNVRQWVIDHAATAGSPAIPQRSHTETTWASSSPGPDWAPTGLSRTLPGRTEETTTRDGAQPAGDGWTQDGPARTVPAVVDHVWAASAPEGYTATGAFEDRDTTERTDETSPTAPEGDGWSPVPDSRIVVVDEPAHTTTVGGSTEQVLVSPAQDATPPCPEVDGGQVPTTGQVGGPTPGHAAVSGVEKGAHHGPAVDAPTQAAGAATATVLPATGNPVSPVLLATGLGALLTGGVLVRAGRRRTS